MQEITGYENKEGKIKYSSEKGIEYNLEKPDIIIGGGGVIGGEYRYDDNDISGEPGSPVINAVDINWGAYLPITGATIDTTTDLLKHIDAKQSSIPILDNYAIENSDSLPDKYIGIRSERDIVNNNADYLSILFSAIRSLQAEVSKLRNTFKYGLNSYNDTNTALGNVITEYEETQDEEPLWAVDEEDLSEILEFKFTFDLNHSLKPAGNVKINSDNLEINSDGAVFEAADQFKSVVDQKIFLYLTTENLNVRIVLKKKDSDEILTINLADINATNINSNKFDIMFLLSRKVEVTVNENKTLVGNNYVYISIGEYLKGNKFAEGYYDISSSKLQKQESLLDDIYEITEVQFGENKIWKFNAYHKYQDFTRQVIPSAPSDNDYKYDVAHITIRSVKTFEILNSIKDKLQENELIFVNSTNKLYIKTNGNLINIGAQSSGGETDPVNPDDGGNNDNIMTNQEILKALAEQGIISIKFKNEDYDDTQLDEKYAAKNIESYNLNSIGSIQFINEETGKKFNITVDSHGNLISDELGTETIESKLTKTIQDLVINDNNIGTGITIDENNEVSIDDHADRGFFALYNLALNNIKNDTQRKDAKLNADRIKIGAIYAPLDTDKVHGCSHGYIELENLSDKDFPLDGVYLHYGKQKSQKVDANNTDNEYKIYHLPLKGVLKKYSTFLIRCAKYAEPTDVNTFINVNTYDMEWIVREDYPYTDADGKQKSERGQLLDLTQSKNNTTTNTEYKYGFLLNYTKFNYYNDDNTIDLNKTEILQNKLRNVGSNDRFVTANPYFGIKTTVLNTYAHFIRRDLIDAICISGKFGNWFGDAVKIKPKYLPAAFPFNQKSNSIYKNVFSLDPAKQAFNALNYKDSSRVRWHKKGTDLISLSLDKEFISFPKSQLIKPISDYAPKASFENKTVCTDKTQLDTTKPNIVACSYGINIYTTRCFNWISAGLFNEFVWLYNENNELIGKFESYKDGDAGKTPGTSYPRRKEFGADAINVIYKRITNRFPASNIQYTSHKCILEFNVGDNPVTYKYIIAREDTINKNIPSSEYRSDEMELTIYPYNYQPKIYQTSDQQGFHWIEYQAWTAAANKIRQKIDYDLEHENIIPIVINTGDMTQNGTRLNEWLDYYNGGYEIFKKYCQNNIVGNNDLCDNNPNILGTGDDTGKSNGYYFHIFNCVDVDETNLPIVDAFGTRTAKVIPSLYYLNIDYDDTNTNPTKRMLMINSEITKINCQKWFGLKVSKPNNDDKQEDVAVNLYTGFTISKLAIQWSYEAENLHFRTIYDMLCKMTEDSNIKYIAVCHEMPFTVITKESLANTQMAVYRSISNAEALVGSHLNQIDKTDFGPGIYWFSRLLEYRNIGICIGGHKHTYAVTYPVCENYYWKYNSELIPNNIDEYYFESWNNSAKEVKYGKGIVKVIETDENYTTVEVIENKSTDPNAEDFVGQKFKITLPINTEDPIQLYTLDNTPVNIWVTVEKKNYLWSFIQPIPMAVKTPDNYINTYSLEWELITENNINKNRINWYFDSSNCSELSEWNDLDQNYIVESGANIKKYYNNLSDGKGSNLSKYPFCVSISYADNERPGYVDDYGIDSTDSNTFRKLKNRTQATNIVAGNYMYYPIQYILQSGTLLKGHLYNENGDLIKRYNNHPVRYFMMQATGYKLKSNKELPSQKQRYSCIIPQTTLDGKTDKPAAAQQKPMYGEIYFTTDANNNQEYINLSIIRINNILTTDADNFLEGKNIFTQMDYCTSPMQLEYVREFNNNESDSNTSKRSFGKWIKFGKANDKEIELAETESATVKNTITPLFVDPFNKSVQSDNYILGDNYDIHIVPGSTSN